MSKEQCLCEKEHYANSHSVVCQKAGECICGPCECDCHYGQKEPVEPVETIEEFKGCKHTELITASRNAVVGVRAGLSQIGIRIMILDGVGQEISRQENAYDALLMNIHENGCKSCKYDALEPNRKSDYLWHISVFVEEFGLTRKEITERSDD